MLPTATTKALRDTVCLLWDDVGKFQPRLTGRESLALEAHCASRALWSPTCEGFQRGSTALAEEVDQVALKLLSWPPSFLASLLHGPVF